MNVRLLKESVIAAMSAAGGAGWPRDPAAYGWYYCASGALNEAQAAARSMQDLEEMPWPEKNCVLMGEGPPLGGGVHANWIVRRSATELCLCGQLFENRIREILRDGPVMGRVQKTDQGMAIDIRAALSEILAHMGDAPNTKELCDRAAAAIKPDGWNWVFLEGMPSGRTKDHVEQEIMFYSFLEAIAAVAVPTGYTVNVRTGAFGTGSIRKYFASAPILAFINFDRLFNLYRDRTDKPTNGELFFRPRFVHGHTRNLWRLSGVPLEEVPRTPLDRLRLLQKYKVRRTYISPHWQGDREFILNGLRFEVDTTERELPPL